MKGRGFRMMVMVLAAVLTATFAVSDAQAALVCGRSVTADVIVLDKPLMYNRLGAGNVNGKMYALRRDVVTVPDFCPNGTIPGDPGACLDTDPNIILGGTPLTLLPAGFPVNVLAGNVDLRGDKRPRPLILRVRKGDCLTVNLTNLLTDVANPFNAAPGAGALETPAGENFTVPLDDQVYDRHASFHAAGLQWVNGSSDDGSYVGANPSSIAADSGGTESYQLYADKEGVFAVVSHGATFGSDGNMGNVSNGLFGQVIVEPTGAAIYRGQVFEEEYRLAADADLNGALTGVEVTSQGHPIINYEATYPSGDDLAFGGNNNGVLDGAEVPTVWDLEGKGGLPILNMMRQTGGATYGGTPDVEIVHSEINAVVAYGGNDEKVDTNGRFPQTTYPLESQSRRNPTVPNRLEPFRDFATVFSDETVNGQAFPGFFVNKPTLGNPVFKYVMAGVKDAFMINYGSGGIGSEIVANRLGVGPMHDCLDCAFEEFFLSSFTVADPAMTVDMPANFGLELCEPVLAGRGQVGFNNCPVAAMGPKANYAIGAEDPSNVHHSYTGDFTKFHNTHNGKEQHIFHLHNHQWLFNANDDNANYLDAQGIGPGSGYTYEINFGGSGNRNKSAGDSIFHCHFYPHFAQGMWYHWRHHDVTETGTVLAATPNAPDLDDFAIANGYHNMQWALANTTPAAGARAYPDGEITAGTPIPAVVPLPGKPMAPMPGRATVVTKFGVDGTPVGSNAMVIDRDINPGYPFWVAGIEDIVGQRAPTPPLDMADNTVVGGLPTVNVPVKDATGAIVANVTDLYGDLLMAQADGFNGGLPRHALQGYADNGATLENVISPIDFSKVMSVAKPVYFPEEGTDLEQVAMAFHSLRTHPSFRIVESAGTFIAQAASFVTNGSKPVIGAPYHNPCIDDEGDVLNTGVTGDFFSGGALPDFSTNPSGPLATQGSSVFTSDNPRIYKGTNMQFDAVLNKVGYHYPQQRIVALWEDVGPVIAKQKAPEPLVMRLNTFDCAIFHHSNLVPEVYELDDYQVRTPTDIIGQHIHLPKWDLTTADGAANGWNYEDGTLSPGAVRERIEAINAYVVDGGNPPAIGTGSGALSFDPNVELHAAQHPYFSSVATALDNGAPVGTLMAKETFGEAWLGARTTTQRWWADPVVNVSGVDRGLGIIFTHDHYGPSTHQQIGLYATVLTEPAGATWAHNETGSPLGCDNAVNTVMPMGTTAENTTPCRWDGGPTSWQAIIDPPAVAPDSSTVKSETVDPFREFYFEYSDFQHAYEAGVYVGTNQMGLPLAGTAPGNEFQTVGNEGNPAFDNTSENAFRFAINPPARTEIAFPDFVFPDLVLETAGGVLPVCPMRPCPQAIDVEDPGVLVMNYRQEPVGLRIYDPDKIGPDGNLGMQADGQRGDLAFALQSRTDRAIALLNQHPPAGFDVFGTIFPPPLNSAGVKDGDPFTPVPRALAGDVVRVKMQAGGHEEEHKGTFPGLQWLQGGSGHGRAPNSGWRSTQSGGISEQFTLSVPVFASLQGIAFSDIPFSVDSGNDGWWSGMWTFLRSYSNQPNNLAKLKNNDAPLQIANADDFRRKIGPGNKFEELGACPKDADVREYDVTAVLANEVLTNALGVTIPTPATTVAGTFLNAVATQHVGGFLDNNGGTLVYNHRDTTVSGNGIDPLTGQAAVINHQGPIHDPTAILYMQTEDLVFDTTCLATDTCRTQIGTPVGLQPMAPVEPLVLRAAAGECIEVTLRNALPPLADVNIGTPEVPIIVQNSTAPDLASYSSIQGVVKRNRVGVDGATTFNSNLYRPSSWVGLTPQLVAVDTWLDSALVVGGNPANNLVSPRGSRKYHWYAGNLTAVNQGTAMVGNGKKKKEVVQFELVPTPVELGGSNLLPSDKVKQGAKSLVGALVVEPIESTWVDNNTMVFDHQTGGGLRLTRAQATVYPTVGGNGIDTRPFRDFSLVLTKGLTQYYKEGDPVEHMNGEGAGIPEDSQEASGMALNYGIEPMWFRFGILPQSDFGGAGCGTLALNECYGDIENAREAFSNSLVGGDPVTPVFFADVGEPARIRISNPQGTTRGSTFALHGHSWQRDPYVCPDEAWDGLLGKCMTPATGSIIFGGDPLVGSRAIGTNPIGFTLGGQESWNAPTSYDIVLDSAGGCADANGECEGESGDYLFRDQASFGSASGVWGILRVQ